VKQMTCLSVYQEPHVMQSYCDHFMVRSCNIEECPYSTFSSNVITINAMAPKIQMSCCVSSHLYLLMVESLIGLQVSRSKQLPSLTVIMALHYILLIEYMTIRDHVWSLYISCLL
jgi:hypothetical protein